MCKYHTFRKTHFHCNIQNSNIEKFNSAIIQCTLIISKSALGQHAKRNDCLIPGASGLPENNFYWQSYKSKFIQRNISPFRSILWKNKHEHYSLFLSPVIGVVYMINLCCLPQVPWWMSSPSQSIRFRHLKMCKHKHFFLFSYLNILSKATKTEERVWSCVKGRWFY